MRGAVPGQLVLAEVPVAQLRQLEERPEVASLRVPLRFDQPTGPATPAAAAAVTGQHVAKTNADDWRAAGLTGAGVKVGIIDSFDQAAWNAAVAAGELNPTRPGPSASRTESRATLWGGGTHGVNVAEVISDMAPDASYYLVAVDTASDLQAAVNYLAGNGVRSSPAPSEPPSSTAPATAPARWRRWSTTPSPGHHLVQLRRQQRRPVGWPQQPGGWVLLARRLERPRRGQLPELLRNRRAHGVQLLVHLRPAVERLGAAAGPTTTSRCTPTPPRRSRGLLRAGGPGRRGCFRSSTPVCTGSGVKYIAVKLYAVGSGTAGDVLEFMVNGAGLRVLAEPRQRPGQPISDSASAGALAVGAVGENPFGTSLSPYSSRGPTNDGRIKPDLSAATCVDTHTSAGCFNGTSSATPVVAGAAALVSGRRSSHHAADAQGLPGGQRGRPRHRGCRHVLRCRRGGPAGSPDHLGLVGWGGDR